MATNKFNARCAAATTATGIAVAIAGLLTVGTGTADAQQLPDLSVVVNSYTCDATGKFVNLTVTNTGGAARNVQVNGFVSNWGYGRQIPLIDSGRSVQLPIKIPFPTLGWQPQGVAVHGTADSSPLNNVYAGLTYPTTGSCSTP
ncbi:hypothetical protein [Gordonia sp. NPDC058843]|uniref:hypothetical protein n=1 Tax=Gordonia sp. NPDC058843 TaxID=3346648 RepID=UPI0036C03ABB